MGGGKIYKGNITTIESSMVGEAVSTSKFDYDANSSLIYLAECKFGVLDNEYSHFINKFEYDASFNLIRILNASNRRKLIPTSITIVSNTQYSTIVFNGSIISDIKVGDELFINTTLNVNKTSIINKIDTATGIITLLNNDLTAENFTPLTDDKAIVTLKGDTMDFAKRSWDLRKLYYYF